MIEVYLQNSIITFDGRVVEVFSNMQPAQRYHVSHIKSAEVPTDRKGRRSLSILLTGHGGIMTPQLEGETLADAEQLVEAINKRV